MTTRQLYPCDCLQSATELPKYQCLFITNALSGLSCNIPAQQTLFCASSHNLIEKAVIIDSTWEKASMWFKGGS